MKKAVCALISNGNKFLGVTRPGTTDKWGLPGGKVEEGETLEEAIIREVKEETGLDFKNPTIVFSHECPGRTNYETTTFTGEISTPTISENENVFFPKEGELGIVKWVTEEELQTGPFGQYNKLLFDVLKKDTKEKLHSEIEQYEKYVASKQ